MKKVLLGIATIASLIVLTACNNESKETKNSSSETKTSEKVQNDKETTVDGLDKEAAITSDGKTMYTLKVTEVKDVTEEAKNDTINDSNFLDFYSSNQAKQAVRVTFLMKNDTKENLSMPYLDEDTVTDSEGINSLGGWKNEGSNKTEFGHYMAKSDGSYNSEQYEVKPDESKMATSTVLLANTSDNIKIKFVSTKFDQTIIFDLPVSH